MADDCAICMDPISPTRTILLCPCKHKEFHFKCISKMIKFKDSTPTCPFCRGEIKYIVYEMQLSQVILALFESNPLLFEKKKSKEKSPKRTRDEDEEEEEEEEKSCVYIEHGVLVLKRRVIKAGRFYDLEEVKEMKLIIKFIKDVSDGMKYSCSSSGTGLSMSSISSTEDEGIVVNDMITELEMQNKEMKENDSWDEYFAFNQSNQPSSQEAKKISPDKFYKMVEDASEKDNVIYNVPGSPVGKENRLKIASAIINFMNKANENDLKELVKMDLQSIAVTWLDVAHQSNFLRWVSIEHILYPLRKYINWNKQPLVRAAIVKCMLNDSLDTPTRVFAVKIINEFTSNTSISNNISAASLVPYQSIPKRPRAKKVMNSSPPKDASTSTAAVTTTTTTNTTTASTQSHHD